MSEAMRYDGYGEIILPTENQDLVRFVSVDDYAALRLEVETLKEMNRVYTKNYGNLEDNIVNVSNQLEASWLRCAKAEGERDRAVADKEKVVKAWNQAVGLLGRYMRLRMSYTKVQSPIVKETVALLTTLSEPSTEMKPDWETPCPIENCHKGKIQVQGSPEFDCPTCQGRERVMPENTYQGCNKDYQDGWNAGFTQGSSDLKKCQERQARLTGANIKLQRLVTEHSGETSKTVEEWLRLNLFERNS